MSKKRKVNSNENRFAAPQKENHTKHYLPMVFW